jgi:DNA-binding transcriptional ArsR family regulator
MTAPAENEPGPPPVRELRDPKILRALSHPVRLSILEELVAIGPATATQLAERIGESPANCSWHLRQLARYDLVEEAGGGTGRQRPWRFVPQSLHVPDREAGDEPELVTAYDMLNEVLMGREFEAWRAWQLASRDEAREWVEASFSTSSIGVWLTAEELAAFRQELREVVNGHIISRLNRIDAANRPEGSRPIRFVAWGVPNDVSRPP